MLYKDKSNYKFEMHGNPEYGFAEITLSSNNPLKVEAAAMVCMDTNIKMQTKFKGGFGRFITGESLFLNEFSAENSTGVLGIAPSAPGTLEHIYLENDIVFLQNTTYVASSKTINIETKWQGLVKGFFSDTSLFLIKCSGNGDLWFNSFGGIIEIDVENSYIVDTGCIVGFSGGLDYSISTLGNYKSFFFSGEGLVCNFTGKGKIWIQTRKQTPYKLAFEPFRPRKN